MKNKLTKKECSLDFLTTVIRYYFCTAKYFSEEISPLYNLEEILTDLEDKGGVCYTEPLGVDTKEGEKNCWVIWIASDQSKKSQAEMVVHETVHVVTEIINHFLLCKDDDELRAYLTQYIIKSIKD